MAEKNGISTLAEVWEGPVETGDDYQGIWNLTLNKLQLNCD